jgi:hypothetical protein
VWLEHPVGQDRAGGQAEHDTSGIHQGHSQDEVLLSSGEGGGTGGPVGAFSGMGEGQGGGASEDLGKFAGQVAGYEEVTWSRSML